MEEVAIKPQENLGKTSPYVSKKDYVPSLFEWIFTHGQQIINSSSTPTVLYTVPKGYTFYLVSVWATISHNANAQMLIACSEFNKNLLAVYCSPNQQGSNSIVYSFPIAIHENSVIEMDHNGSGRAGIHGFIVKNDSF